VGINLSSDDDTLHLLEPDALADQKVLAGGDVGDDGATSTEPTAPIIFSSSLDNLSLFFNRGGLS
jgi:hypothetical protein